MKYFFCLGILLLNLLNTISQEVQFETHIQPIIRDHCLKCHQNGGIAPMPLTSYEEVTSYGKMIQYVTQTRYMPPWKASTPNVGYMNQNQLSEEEIKLISTWVENGMPGSPDIPADSPDKIDDHLEDYDLEIGMTEEFEQYDIYFDQFHVFVIPFDVGQDTFVESLEFVPGDKSIVRSCHISITTNPAILKKDDWDPRYGYHSFGGVDFPSEWSHWYTWNAGDQPFQSDSLTNFLPAKGFFLFHMHYGPTASKSYDQSKLRIKFSEEKRQILQTIPLINQNQLTIQPFSIPPNSKKNVHAKTRLPGDTYLYGLFPQSNLICKSWQIYAKIPGEQAPVHLLNIKDWDFKWRRGYRFNEPRLFPKGTEIHAFATFDNTTENLSLPDDEAIQMKWGDQMFGETFIVHFIVSTPRYLKEISSDADSVQLIPASTSVTNERLIVRTTTAISEGYFFELRHWDQEYHRVFSIKVNQSAHHLKLSGVPSGNYIVYLKDSENQIVDSVYFVKGK